MKHIPQVAARDIIRHKGDLTIDGDIGANATIEVEDGSLIVTGNVASEAQITIRASDEFKRKTMGVRDGVTISRGGSVVISGSYDGDISIFSMGNFSNVRGKVKSTSCDVNCSIGNVRIMSGHVNIDNRIYTEKGQVRELGDEQYEITAPSGDGMFDFFAPSRKPPEVQVTATIDGIRYTGFVIKVDGKKVTVDGKAPAQDAAAGPAAADTPAEKFMTPPKLIIQGTVHDRVVIRSDVAIEAVAIGMGCRIESSNAGLSTGTVGQHSQISTCDSIIVTDVGKNVTLISSKGKITGHNIDVGCTLTARDGVVARNMISNCRVTCAMGDVSAEDVGPYTMMNVRDGVNVQNIGSRSKITTSMGECRGRALGNNVEVTARDGLRLKSTGPHCILSTSMGTIEVDGLVDESSTLQARDGIAAGEVGDRVRLSSSMGDIRVFGKSGDDLTLSARDAVRLQNVGDRTTITSSMSDVSLKNIGIRGTVCARDGIDIDGSCPDPDSLSLNSSSRSSRIRKPKKAAALVAPAFISVAKVLDDDGDEDLAKALSLSMDRPSVAALSMFAAASAVAARPAVVPVAAVKSDVAPPSADKMPEGFLCPISLDVMQDPVLLILDGRSYERSNIIEWLTKHRNSPHNRAELGNQSIESVLVPNRALKESIEEFLQQHPKEASARAGI
jgi:hypothetical protein